MLPGCTLWMLCPHRSPVPFTFTFSKEECQGVTAMTRDSVIYWAKMLWDIDLIISSVVTDASMMLYGGFTKALSIVPEGGNAAARGGNALALWAVICDSIEC